MLRLLDVLSDEPSRDVASGVFPPVNVTQDGDHFYVRAEIPGVDPEALSISAIRNRLHERVSYHRRERAEGSFNRGRRSTQNVWRPATPTAVDIFENDDAITLLADIPGVKAADLKIDLRETIDQPRIEAKLSDGVLRLELPKVENAKPRQMTVRTD